MPRSQGFLDLRFSVDLVTFSDPRFWGLDDRDALIAYAWAEPRRFWCRMLDLAAEAGLDGIELTFAPFGWQDAARAFGSVAGFARALQARGLAVSGGFFADLEHGVDIADLAVAAQVLDRAERYGEAIAACGGDALVVGLPMRATCDANPPVFVDLDRGRRIAYVLNQMGARLHRNDVRLALHTEAHSMLAHARDVDLFMLLTDPVYVGLCPDAAHLVLSGADPVSVVRRHAERVVTAHWKDAIGPMPVDVPIDADIHRRHRPYFCRLGDGRVDWAAWARLYRDRGLGGWAVLELDASANPLTDIAAAQAFVEAELRPILGPLARPAAPVEA